MSQHGESRHRVEDGTHRKDPIHIQKSHVGLLHKHMGVSSGKHLSTGSIEKDKAKAKAHGDSAEVKRDTFALNARKWHHG